MKKKIFATLLAAVMTIASTMTAFADEGYTTKLSLADADWSYQVWGDKEGSSTTVTGEGTYTLTLAPYESTNDAGEPVTNTGDGATVFVIDFTGAGTAFASYELDDLKIKVDGTELAVDLSKVVTGDLENNGNWRIEIYNEYGSTKTDSPIDKTQLVFTQSCEVTFTIDDPATQDPAPTPTPEPTPEPTPAPDTADVAPVAALATVAVLAAVVVLKKRTVTE